MCAYLLWRALFDDVFLGVLQSRTEDDSKDFLKENIWFLWESLPPWFKFVLFEGNTDAVQTALELRFANGNRIKGMAQGPHVARGKTPSVVVLDEAAFHPEFADTLTALLPLAEKKAQLIFVSSVEPGAFWEVVEAEPASEKVVLVKPNTYPKKWKKYEQGVTAWKLRHGGHVLRVHFSSDPSKDTQWLEEADKRFPGGLEGTQFRKEMNIEADAGAGDLYYPHFVDGPPHVNEFELVPGKRKWLVCDYGYRNPTAALVIGEIGDQVYGVRHEFYQPGLSIDQLKAVFTERFGPANDFYLELIDPSTDAVREAETKSHFWMFNNGRNARNFLRADNAADGRILISEWLHENRLIIHPECSMTRWEFGRFRHDDWTTTTSLKNNPKEKVRKKDDHAMDALKYFANNVRWEQLPEPDAVEAERDLVDRILQEYSNTVTWIGEVERDECYTLEGLRNKL